MSNEPNQDNERQDAPAGQEQAQDTMAGGASPDDIIEALRGELEQLRAQSLLERADLENQRKRMAREVDTARRYANERLLGELLPVFDSLEAGLVNAPEGDPLRAGVELTLRQLHKVTGAHGLEETAPGPGDAFDPERHQAMSAVEPGEFPPGCVVQLLQKGYVLNERLLRPALVVVARHDD